MKPLNGLRSMRTKVVVLVTAAVVVAAVLEAAMTLLGLPSWLVVPIAVVVALATTQVLARGTLEPLTEMISAAEAMDRGDYTQRVSTTARDEVGALAHAFNAMATELEAVDRQRADVVAAITAELSSPLPAVRSLLQNIGTGVVRPDPTLLRTALGETDRMRELVAALLDLTRLDAGETHLEPEHVAMRPFLQDALKDARTADYAVQYDVKLEPFDLVVEGDRRRMQLLVANLLDNAARHSPNGATVVLQAYRGTGKLVLDVHDSGPALDPDQRATVVQRLTQGTGPEAGEGLGLAMAQWITALLGGTLEVLEGRTHGNLVRATVPHVPVRAGWKGAARVPRPDDPEQPAVETPDTAEATEQLPDGEIDVDGDAPAERVLPSGPPR